MKKIFFAVLILSGMIFWLSSASAEATASTTATKKISAIKIKADGAKVFWEADGFSAKGYKLVWSKTNSPTYPLRNGDRYVYASSPNSHDASIYAFDGDGIYYARVCEYLGGACGIYSNEIMIELKGANTDTSDKLACANEGELVNLTVNPEYQAQCCNGLKAKYMNPSVVGGSSICYDPIWGEPSCYEKSGLPSGWYYPTGKLLKATGCVRQEVVCTMEYNPVCGSDQKTYSNSCMAKAAGITSVTSGECAKKTDTNSKPAIPKNCQYWFDGCNNCAVKDGVTTGCTKKACLMMQTPKCLKYYDSTTVPVQPVGNQDLATLKARLDAQEKEIKSLKESITKLMKMNEEMRSSLKELLSRTK